MTNKIEEEALETVEKVVEKVTNKVNADDIIDKVNSTTFSGTILKQWEEKDKKINYNRSHLYGDIAYHTNFKDKNELVARAGILYYLK